MNIGTILILVSLFVSLISLVFHARSVGGHALSKITARRLFLLSGIAISFAVIMLFIAFITHNFQFSYVYGYSSLELPLAYRIAAFWAGQEGTFLLWAFLLFLIGLLIIKSRDEDESVLMAFITITQIFILIILSIYSPFRYVWQAFPEHFALGAFPQNGTGLNPLLQDPWMVLHPPVLFIGYASSTVPFAYAVTALMRGDYSGWAVRSSRWVLFSMTSLGIGIFLGGYWAYKVLGWGGYWGWDPVENSSLIPWLCLVALTHGLMVQRKTGALVRTNLFLALLSFILVFYSTFLTRSGVLSNFSVHSFGDLGLSRHLIFFMLFYVLISAFFMIKRFPDIRGEALGSQSLSWDSLISYGIVTLLFYSLLVLIGTSMPILSSIFSSTPFSVKVDYYNNISVPLGILIFVLIILTGYIRFNRNSSLRTSAIILAATIIMAAGFNLNHTKNILAYAFSTLAFMLIIINIMDLFRIKSTDILPSRLGHMGVGVMVLGIITTSFHSTSLQKILVHNRPETIRTISLTFRGITEEKKSSLLYTFAEGKRLQNVKTPYYFNERMNSIYREPYIRYGFFNDVYISPLEYRPGLVELTRIHLHQGQEADFQGMKVRFNKFEIDHDHMKSAGAQLAANLSITRYGKTYTLRPGLRFSGGKRNRIQTTLPGTGRKVSLLEFDVKGKQVIIDIEPPKGTPIPPDRVLVEVSFKRLIWFVWFGTILIASGGTAGLVQAWRRKKSAPPESSASKV